jgi:hypothetical protein
MPDIQEAKCYEFTVRILPPPLGAPTFISVYALGRIYTIHRLNSYAFLLFWR